MYEDFQTHVCTVNDIPETQYSNTKLKRKVQDWITISERNRRSIEFFGSRNEILKQKMQHINSGSWIIHPFCKFLVYYELWMAFILINCMVYLPLNAAFPYLHKNRIYTYLDISLSICCLMNNIVRYRTGFIEYKNRNVIMKQSTILKKQIFSIYFLGDLIQVIPKVRTHYKSNYSWIISILCLLKCARVVTLFEYLDNMTRNFRFKNLIYKVLKIPLLLLLIHHFMACMFYLIPQIRLRLFGERHPKSWTHEIPSIDNVAYGHIYMICFYKAAGHIVGTFSGYDKTSVWEELAFEIFAYVSAKIYLCYLIVKVKELLKIERELEIKYYAMMNQVRCYLSGKHLPLQIQAKIEQSYKYKYRGKYFREYNITNFFTDRLKKDINYHFLSRFVANTPLFEQLPKRTIENVLTQLKMEIYLPSEMIIRAGTLGDCMYIIGSGSVAVVTTSGKEVCHLQDGDYFGEIALLGSLKKRISSVIAIEFCEIYKLSKKDFKKCFEQHPELFKDIQKLAIRRIEHTEQIERNYRDSIDRKKMAAHGVFRNSFDVSLTVSN